MISSVISCLLPMALPMPLEKTGYKRGFRIVCHFWICELCGLVFFCLVCTASQGAFLVKTLLVMRCGLVRLMLCEILACISPVPPREGEESCELAAWPVSCTVC